MNTILMTEFERVYGILGDRVGAFANQTILITGATGLIGSWVVNFFKWMNVRHNANIQIVATATSQNSQNGVEYIQCDLSIPNSFDSKRKFDRIIHAAGPTDPVIYAKNPAGVMKTNFIGTMQILDNAIKTGAQVLFISSGEVYGNNTDHAFTEDDKCTINTQAARSCYPAVKVACESLCQSYAAMNDLHINIVRPGFVYGPNISDKSTRVNAQFLRCAIAGKNLALGSRGNQRRSWVYVADAASAILYVMLNAPRGGVYNIATPDSVASIYEYACIMARVAGVNVDVAPNAPVATNADSILSGKKLITMGWQPQWGLEYGIQNTIFSCVNAE